MSKSAPAGAVFARIIAVSVSFGYDTNVMATETVSNLDEFLTRGVEKIFPSEDFLRARLAEGKRLTLYLGIDATGPSLHLGHAITLRKLRRWQEMGHRAVLLVGDFTSMIGDPTDKTATRRRLTREEVLENAKNYKQQASKILSFDGENPAELRFNSEWLSKLTLTEIVDLASHFTVQQMLERDMFERRMQEAKPIYLHEFLYPLMQGYDSVALDTDGEIGGNDQTFNMLAGRDLMKDLKGMEKFVIGMELLTDPTGKKMGKSEGNMITLGDAPEDMYGKVMSWPDGMIVSGFEILTDVPRDELRTISRGLSSETLNPRDAKDRLAREIVAFFHGREAADAAAESFVKTFRQHETPDEMPEVAASTVLDALVGAALCASRGDARRQIEQGGVKVNGTVVKDIEAAAKPGDVIQKGKRFFVRVI